MSGDPVTTPVPGRRRARTVFVAAAAVLAAAALIVEPLIRAVLAGGRVIDLGMLQLRLTYNTGVAFSLGNQLPTPVLVAVTVTVTAGIAVYAWRTAPTSSAAAVIGFAAIFAGAAANVIDRLVDGKVTDYLHTGWWPTFNLADTFITCGVALLLVSLFVDSRSAGTREEATS